MRLIKVLGLLLGLCAVPAMGEDRRMLTEDEAFDWRAVGRVNIQGATSSSFCTGALIAADQVLTAAHCVFDSRTRRLVRPEQVHFLAGWRLGEAVAHRRVRRIMVHRGYDPALGLSRAQVESDIAVIELAQPITRDLIEPFERELSPRAGDDIVLVSYSRDRSEAPSIQQPCDTLSVEGRMITMDCTVNFGASGSPVFTITNGRPRISSVISAMGTRNGTDERVAFGAALDDGALASVLRDMVHGDADRGVRRLGSGSISSQIGRAEAGTSVFRQVVPRD